MGAKACAVPASFHFDGAAAAIRSPPKAREARDRVSSETGGGGSVVNQRPICGLPRLKASLSAKGPLSTRSGRPRCLKIQADRAKSRGNRARWIPYLLAVR